MEVSNYLVSWFIFYLRDVSNLLIYRCERTRTSIDPPFTAVHPSIHLSKVHDAAVPRVVKLGRIESLGNIWRDQEVWPEGGPAIKK